MALHRLNFDTTDADTIAASANVGAYVRASDGTLITNTSGALDVYLNNTSIEVTQGTDPWVVSATQLDIDDLDAATDSVAAWLSDGSGNAISSTAGALDVNLKSPLTVDVDLDGIYNVSTNATPDSAGSIYHTRAASITIAEQIERTSAASVGSVLAASISNINAIDINSFNYGINDSSGDAELFSIDNTTGGVKVSVENTIAVQDVALANSSIAAKANQIDVADTAEDLVPSGSVLSDRKYLWVYNKGNKEIYIGGSGVTVADGFPLPPQSILEMRLGAAVDIQFIGSSNATGSSAEARTLQAA